jgi:diguanylate cyclase (GGDEF)-like protein
MLVALSIALGAVTLLTKSVETQSLLEQKSITPAINLITQEILQPLFMAETIAIASPLKFRMNEDVIDEKKILNKLALISEDSNMQFFVASEKNRMQYNSDGTTFPLIEGKVEWYFREKENDQKTIGILGNRNNIHIYFDVKIHNDEGEFLGFIGVNKKLDTFVNAFEDFKTQFGYDFVFVDHYDNVVLSSDPSIVADGVRIIKLEQLDWFQALTAEQKINQQNSNLVVTVNDEDLLIAEVHIKALNWTLFLVTPLKDRQADVTNELILKTLYILALLILIILVAYLSIHFFQGELAKKYQKDSLTKLPNRAYLAWHFQKMSQIHHSISAIMVDIDSFKNINDTYGHNVGDVILKEIARLLQSQLRNEDIVARWGGEEFLILIPSTDESLAKEIAERARLAIDQHEFKAGKTSLAITASFGVSINNASKELEKIVADADQALYEAKRSGRNRVCFTNHH